MKSSAPFLFFVCLVALSACQTKKIDRLVSQNDSLRIELKKAQSIVANFEKITASLDSLEGLRKIVPTQKTAKPTEKMASSIHAINDHVLANSKTIQSLDGQLKLSRHENSAYIMMMDAVKSELHIRVEEVTDLEQNIAVVEQQNEQMSIEKEKIVSDLLSQVNEKQLALSGLEDRLHKMESHFRNTEAEAVYARAVAVEESARKTRFAPAKKKVALTEALELYKKARALGKIEAEQNIRALEKPENLESVALNSQSL